MDPMTQSSQITSSQGLADGQNSAAKESKLNDSFLSSSPVSLIQSPQDKRVVLGSEKPCEGVATSLRFPSQPGTFTPAHYGSEAGSPDGQPDSPIKTSPVSERIKALEALAAKKKEPEFRSDGGYSHFRDRHYDKSPTETPKSPIEKTLSGISKKEGTADQESPESPFEVLGDLRQVNEFEETEEWMKAHLPPMPDFDAVDLMKGTLVTESVTTKEEKVIHVVIPAAPAAFAGVPDAFMDSPIKSLEVKDGLSDGQKQPSFEEESEFDLDFLPTAYVWDQQEKTGVQARTNVDSEVSTSTAPPANSGSSPLPVSPKSDMSVKEKISDDKTTIWTGDIEPPEASEADSSGESEDTVIEDGVIAPASEPLSSSDIAFSNDPTPAPAVAAPDFPNEEKVVPPPKSERKLMQVPTINVIETDEPNYSEEEMELEAEIDEDYEVVTDSAREATKTPEPEDGGHEQPKTRPLETEFMEGYSPPSSPVDSDVEYSPKRNIVKSPPEMYHEESMPELEASPQPTVPKESAFEISHDQSKKSEMTSNNVNDEPSTIKLPNEEVDFPDDDDEWSDEAQCMLVTSYRTDSVPNKPVPCTESKMDWSSDIAVKETYVESVSLSKTSFIQDDIYDRQSFDYDYDASSPLDEQFVSDSFEIQSETLNSSSLKNDVPEDNQDGENLDKFTSLNDCQGLSSMIEQDFKMWMTTDVSDNIADGAQKIDSKIQEETKAAVLALDKTKDPESTNPEMADIEAADSFVEFMRECLKSRQDEEPDSQHQGVFSESKLCEIGQPIHQSPPTMFMDFEQEQLTISALKELGSSQEDDEVPSLQSKIPDQNDANPSATSIERSTFTSVSTPPCPQSDRASDSMYSKEMEAIDVWVAEAYHLAEHVLTAILTHLSVKDLIHWRDPKKSGVVFGLSMLMLLSLAAFSVISVVSYLLLALLCVTITFRIYKSVVQAVQKSSDGHPFKTLIDKDVSIPPETFRKHVDTSLTYINRALKQMSRLFLVEDLVDSLKLAVVMWLLTYVGAVFNGITILILADILLFAVPPVYEKNKTQIDHYIDVARTQVNTTMAKLQEKLPGAVKRSKTE
uniref:reticulon-3 isoform X3 n=1 Tax=Solea senegalensis TaxID=28829 RepID=UPI001CD84401|nr:reticulon-3 isoform X3 [Solea senegalensis]